MEWVNSTLVSDYFPRSFITTVKCEPVKEEPEWGARGESAAAAAEGLYAGHEVKEEFVIGPDLLQEQDVAVSMQRALNRKDKAPPQLKPAAAQGTHNRPGEGPRCNTSHQQQYSSDAEFVNTGETSYSHDISKTQLRNKPDLKTHSKEKLNSCNFCSKKFKLQSNFKRHLIMHTGEKLYGCDMCEKKFTQNSTLTAHRMIHTGEKPFSCDICKMQFIKKCNLTNHTLIHTGVKSFCCSFCGRKFLNKQGLHRHLQIHTEQVPHSCDICEKIYTQESYLTKHMRIHTGEQPYACPDCDKQFAYAFSLGAHRTQVHNYKNMKRGRNTSVIEVQEQKKHLHIWQLSKETTIESLSAHVRKVLGSEADIEIKQVKPKTEKDYTSFIITALKEQYEELSKPGVWPVNAEFAEWIWILRPAKDVKRNCTPQPGPWR